MPFLLIAEDHPAIAKLLHDDLKREHPDAVIDVAGTQNRVRAQLKNREDNLQRYLVVIFDMMLPIGDDDKPTLAVELAEEIMAHWYQTVVFFISAHKDDSRIKKFVERIRRPRSARRVHR